MYGLHPTTLGIGGLIWVFKKVDTIMGGLISRRAQVFGGEMDTRNQRACEAYMVVPMCLACIAGMEGRWHERYGLYYGGDGR